MGSVGSASEIAREPGRLVFFGPGNVTEDFLELERPVSVVAVDSAEKWIVTDLCVVFLTWPNSLVVNRSATRAAGSLESYVLCESSFLGRFRVGSWLFGVERWEIGGLS